MIGHIRGSILGVVPDRVVVDVGGVGYEVTMTPRSIAQMGGRGETVSLNTHLHVREDGMILFGFLSAEERDLFRVLLGASGVGPKVALSILGVLSPQELTRAVAAEDIDALTRAPGVGKRGAQKIVLDLKPRIADLEAEILDGDSNLSRVRQALEGLGYSGPEIREALSSLDSSLPLQDLIRSALKELAR